VNLKKLQKTIEKIGEGIDPQDDWLAHLIMEKKGEGTICAFDPAFFMSQESKDNCAEAIIKTISVLKPDCACFITTAWTINFEENNVSDLDVELLRSGTMRLADHPKKVEVVSAFCVGERGESEGEVLMMGFIERSPDKHPRIKKWKIMPGGMDSEGRFPEAMREGFRLARNGKEKKQT